MTIIAPKQMVRRTSEALGIHISPVEHYFTDGVIQPVYVKNVRSFDGVEFYPERGMAGVEFYPTEHGLSGLGDTAATIQSINTAAKTVQAGKSALTDLLTAVGIKKPVQVAASAPQVVERVIEVPSQRAPMDKKKVLIYAGLGLMAIGAIMVALKRHE